MKIQEENFDLLKKQILEYSKNHTRKMARNIMELTTMYLTLEQKQFSSSNDVTRNRSFSASSLDESTLQNHHSQQRRDSVSSSTSSVTKEQKYPTSKWDEGRKIF